MLNLLIKTKNIKMNIEINHVLVRTRELKNMIQFFTQVVGLDEGIRPPFDFPGAWLYSNDKPLMHLTEINPSDKNQSRYLDDKTPSLEVGTGIVHHIAFSGTDYPELLERLRQQKIKYFERTVPLTNEHQVFIDGPDNLKLELLFNADKSSINSCI